VLDVLLLTQSGKRHVKLFVFIDLATDEGVPGAATLEATTAEAQNARVEIPR